jgi:hypothetical protein
MCRIHFRERHFWDQLEKIISHSSLYRNVNRCDNAGKSLNTSPYVFTLVHATLSLKNPSPKIKFMERDDNLKHFFFFEKRHSVYGIYASMSWKDYDTHKHTFETLLFLFLKHDMRGRIELIRIYYVWRSTSTMTLHTIFILFAYITW